ncbi:MAG TPA: hypothetical protein VMW50_04895 [Dehalococcoidia bacterium]|nr:hypothetical protein [Dehalococcoidia bacterium]
MEASVRYIPTDISVHEGRQIASGNKPALCFRGKTYAIGIVNEQEGVFPVRLDLRIHDESPLVTFGKTTEEYPVSRFITHIERIMQEKPISDEALQLIKDWPNNPEDFGDQKIEDEGMPSEPVAKSKRVAQKVKANCIAIIAIEAGISPSKIRKYLRSQGMHAPYEDEPKIRKLLKKLTP